MDLPKSFLCVTSLQTRLSAACTRVMSGARIRSVKLRSEHAADESYDRQLLLYISSNGPLIPVEVFIRASKSERQSRRPQPSPLSENRVARPKSHPHRRSVKLRSLD